MTRDAMHKDSKILTVEPRESNLLAPVTFGYHSHLLKTMCSQCVRRSEKRVPFWSMFSGVALETMTVAFARDVNIVARHSHEAHTHTHIHTYTHVCAEIERNS